MRRHGRKRWAPALATTTSLAASRSVVAGRPGLGSRHPRGAASQPSGLLPGSSRRRPHRGEPDERLRVFAAGRYHQLRLSRRGGKPDRRTGGDSSTQHTILRWYILTPELCPGDHQSLRTQHRGSLRDRGRTEPDLP